MIEDRLQNLKKAQCYDEHLLYGHDMSKWRNLQKFDVSWAIWEIERLRALITEKEEENEH